MGTNIIGLWATCLIRICKARRTDARRLFLFLEASILLFQQLLWALKMYCFDNQFPLNKREYFTKMMICRVLYRYDICRLPISIRSQILVENSTDEANSLSHSCPKSPHFSVFWRPVYGACVMLVVMCTCIDVLRIRIDAHYAKCRDKFATKDRNIQTIYVPSFYLMCIRDPLERTFSNRARQCVICRPLS